ncbi:MAG: hypothetical protein OZSIB_2348 [Candidatus Ozemobacter sibiricus]|jgi:competence protein ComGC|uniref:Uncharacterized protein n=1 Tax=Candidatus Ozemobacter sibiricus TaxID=2268124 RepID=A0A367ZUF5_9BACT|nr:MAG: hypothetical protein OZSIB_2348 [Candidatus Ozemobacter sibiricus]
MKRMFKTCVFVLLMMVMSLTLTGCKVDLAKIGNFITKVADVISKVANGIKKFGEGLGKGGKSDSTAISGTDTGTTTGTGTGTSTGTATGTGTGTGTTTGTGTATITSTATGTGTGTATDTAGTGTGTGTSTETASGSGTEAGKSAEAAKACSINRKILAAAVQCYNLDHATMMSSLDINTLVSNRYLKAAPQCPEGGTYVAAGDLTANGRIACSKHGADESQIGDTSADKDEESPGE